MKNITVTIAAMGNKCHTDLSLSVVILKQDQNDN